MIEDAIDCAAVDLAAADAAPVDLMFSVPWLTGISAAESAALAEFWLATDGAHWTHKWVSGPADDAYGVTTSGGHVTALELPGNNLVGEPGATLAPLAATLTTLDLGQNPSMGPPTLSAMTALVDIDLAGCDYDITEVTTLLSNIVTAAATSGTLDIGGSNSSPNPTGQGYLMTLEDRPWTPLTYSTITMINSGTMRIVTANGSAALYASALNLAPYTDRFIAVHDSLLSTAKYCLGYGYQGDNAESLGPQLLLNNSFAAWTGGNPDNYTVTGESGGNELSEVGSGESHGGAGAGACNIYTTGNYIEIYQNVGRTVGRLYKYIINISAVAAGGLKPTTDSVVAWTAVGTHTVYLTAIQSYFQLGRSVIGAANNVTLDSHELYLVGSLDTTAQKIRDAATGSTRNWKTVESGFNPNSTSFKIEIFPVS